MFRQEVAVENDFRITSNTVQKDQRICDIFPRTETPPDQTERVRPRQFALSLTPPPRRPPYANPSQLQIPRDHMSFACCACCAPSDTPYLSIHLVVVVLILLQPFNL